MWLQYLSGRLDAIHLPALLDSVRSAFENFVEVERVVLLGAYYSKQSMKS
jgi:hypothetical protein